MSGRVVLGRYRIVAPLARGGMGIIYLGRLEGAAGFSKPVVIKTVIPDAKDTRAAQLFVREARILSNLEHPSIVGVLDFGEVDGEYIMVLEYVHGFHLGLWARYVREARGNMPLMHALEVMLPVLEALEFAHKLTRADGTPLDIVHRDVSPANILIDQSGHVKLHDFGIARMADDEFKTQDGTFRGTLSFTAPETLQGVAASARSDLYACGVILYQLIAGNNPFRGEAPSETLHRVMTHQPPLLRTLRDDVGKALDHAIERAMEKDPAKRFASALQFADALRAARTWAEPEATSDLHRAIQHDFGSVEMPQLLGVENLQVRDAAWRASQSTPVRTPLSSSRPPAGSGEPATETAWVPKNAEPATIQALPSHALLALAREGAETFGQPTAAPTAEAVSAPTTASAPPKRRSTLGIAVFASALVLALGGVAYGVLGRRTEPAAPRFLLIEKQADDESPSTSPSAQAPVGVSSAAVAATPGGSAGTPGVTPAVTKAARASDASSSGSSLTAAFQKQRGRVEACFRSNPSAVSTPQLTLHFQVAATGSVQSADLSPPSVAGSPLGACILGIARSTRFPVGDSQVSFTIPITAKKAPG
jgi:serine/threonine-protein kinase